MAHPLRFLQRWAFLIAHQFGFWAGFFFDAMASLSYRVRHVRGA
jgi:hypothetical protein